MRIAVFTETFSPQVNGVAVFLSQVLPKLAQNNYVLLFTPDGKKMRVEKHGENFKVLRLPGRPFPFYKGYYVGKLAPKFIHDTLKREKIDICHLHIPVALGLQGLAMAKLLRIPTIVTYHTDLPEYFPHVMKGRIAQNLAPLYKNTTKRLVKEVYSQADVVTAPSKEYLEMLKSYGLKNVIYLPNGIDLAPFESVSKGNWLRKAYNIPDEKKILLYFGRVSFEKKISLLLLAFKIIDSRKDVFLLVCGTGPEYVKCMALSKKLGIKNIAFAGFIPKDKMVQTYADADVFVSASDTETMGITFLEAMACGLPVIGVDKGGARELIQEGTNGLLALPQDAKSLASKMETLVENQGLCMQMGLANREKAKQFSIEEASSKLIQLYEKVIKGRKRKNVVFPKALNTKIAQLISFKKAITWLRKKIGRA